MSISYCVNIFLVQCTISKVILLEDGRLISNVKNVGYMLGMFDTDYRNGNAGHITIEVEFSDCDFGGIITGGFEGKDWRFNCFFSGITIYDQYHRPT